jgi:hypothetical protein
MKTFLHYEYPAALKVVNPAQKGEFVDLLILKQNGGGLRDNYPFYWNAIL